MPDMRDMTSAATSAGEATILVIFEPGSDPMSAVLNVQTRINTVKNRLPPLVEGEGIIVMQADEEHADVREHLQHGSESHDQNFRYNYAFVNLVPEIKRVHGIGLRDDSGNRPYAMGGSG